MREELGIETTLIKGRSGIFEVKVDDIVVAKKTWNGFPSEQDILAGVRRALPGT
ncbi:MAG: selenoprotein W-related protein [Myxococcota bacterium]